MKRAIVLCSGGLDSVVTSHFVRKIDGYKEIVILFFNYGQKSLIQERKFSKSCAKELNASFIEFNLSELLNLSTSLINIKGKSLIQRKGLRNTKKESKKWYVPGRNTIFLSYALSLADSLLIRTGHIHDIFVGFKCEGSEPYPDTTKEYLNIVNKLSNVAFPAKFKIKAPLINMDKEDIILLGKKLKVNFQNTFSCYLGYNKHCGQCLSCRLRKEGFYWANTEDPTIYVK